jgi:hypothetical protein
MTIKSIDYIALFAGALLWMSRSGYRPHLWTRFEHRDRSGSESKSGSRAKRMPEPETASVSQGPAGEVAQPADSSLKLSAAIYGATLTPYGAGGRYFGGHNG